LFKRSWFSAEFNHEILQAEPDYSRLVQIYSKEEDEINIEQ